jgi:hypothetical protein
MPPIRFDGFIGTILRLAGVDKKASPNSINFVSGDALNVADNGTGGATVTIPSASDKQPLDADLTAIAALSPANDNILQRKSGAWTDRTVAQLLADIAAARSKTIELFDDFVAPQLPAGTGAGVTLSVYAWRHSGTFSYPTSPDDPRYGYAGLDDVALSVDGVRAWTLDASAGGTLFAANGTPGIGLLPNMIWKQRMFHGALNTGGNTETIFVGMYQTVASAVALRAAYGAVFKVTSGGNIYSVTRNASGEEAQDTGVTFGLNTYRTFEMRTNSDSSEVYFYIDGVLKTTHTTYIFTNSLRSGFAITRDAGASGNTSELFIDYFYFFAPGIDRV